MDWPEPRAAMPHDLAARLGTSAWPVLGRDAELAAVDRALELGRAGVVFAGDAGVGKTRIAREAVERASERGHVGSWLTASGASSQVPLGVVGHLTAGAPATRGPGLLARVARSLGHRPGAPLPVLGIDDAHLLDDASAVLVYQLAATGMAFVVAVLRSGALAPDPVTALWKDCVADRLDVRPLAHGQVARLAESMLGAPVDMATQLFLCDTSAGNVLFLRELIVAGLSGSSLRDTTGVWTWNGPLAVSPRLVDVLESTLGRLEPDEAEVLEVLAYGQPLEAPLLESWCHPHALQAVERRGLVVSERSGRRLLVRLPTPLHEHVLRARTPPTRARAIQRRLADAIAGAPTARPHDPLRVAALRLETGDPVPSELLVLAAQRALGEFDCELAEGLARAGLDAGGGAPAATALARALYLQGRSAESLEAVSGLDVEAMSDADLAAAATQRAQSLCWGLGRARDAERILAKAEAAAGSDELRDDLRAARAAVLLHAADDPMAALAVAGGILERQGVGERAAAPAALTSALALASIGRSAEALSAASRWVDVAWRLDGRLELAIGPLLPATAVALRSAGRLPEAVATCRAGYSRALRKGDRLAAAGWVTMLGRTLLDSGQVVSARRVLSEALTACRQPVAACFLPVCLAAIAESAALSGDVARAQEAVAEESGHAPMACFRTDLELARSWLAAASGDLCTGRAIALGAAETAEAEGRLVGAVTALHTAARLGDPTAVRHRLERISGVVDGGFAATCAAHAGALADRDGATLDRAAAEFEGMGAYLLAAEAAAAARAAHQAEGRRGSALASSDRLRSLLERCEGAHSPGLAGLKMAELTVREQEVAHLAASGLSSREIAQRLTLSVRTVDNHLRVTYDKLGVDGRRSLPRALRSHAGTERSGSARRFPLEARAE